MASYPTGGLPGAGTTSEENPQTSAFDRTPSKSPMSSFGLFRGLGSSDKKNRDGQTAKRRGPKPDAKPALTRRQELNRQAQRTHRERKEMYVKALEQEVLHLKELYADLQRERDAVREENRKLKEIMAMHGLNYVPDTPGHIGGHDASTVGSSSISGAYGAVSASTGWTSPPSAYHGVVSPYSGGGPPQNQPQVNNVDFNSTGIDFVLTLEGPCLDHLQMLMVKSQNDEVEFSGHALLASAPSGTHLIERPDVPHKPTPQTMENAGDMMKLLDLSNRLPLDGEITPIMAWAMILKHPRIQELSEKDFTVLKDDLHAKIRCYGFGAVLEEFEVSDALGMVLASKA